MNFLILREEGEIIAFVVCVIEKLSIIYKTLLDKFCAFGSLELKVYDLHACGVHNNLDHGDTLGEEALDVIFIQLELHHSLTFYLRALAKPSFLYCP